MKPRRSIFINRLISAPKLNAAECARIREGCQKSCEFCYSGHQEGRQQEKEEIALSLLREEVDVDLIARTTGLKLEEIEAIKSTEPLG